MQVRIGVLLPLEVLEPVAGILASSSAAPVAGTGEPARRGLLRRKAATPVVESAPRSLDVVAPGQAHLRLASLGNVTVGQSTQLAEVLGEAATGWSAPTLHVDGVAETDDPRALVVALGGDVDALRELARNVLQTVERLGLFLDRRAFRPVVTVATAPEESDPALEAARMALAGYRGPSWTVAGLSLLKLEYDGAAVSVGEVSRLPLGS
jgi:2'-5' RNA ligase